MCTCIFVYVYHTGVRAVELAFLSSPPLSSFHCHTIAVDSLLLASSLISHIATISNIEYRNTVGRREAGVCVCMYVCVRVWVVECERGSVCLCVCGLLREKGCMFWMCRCLSLCMCGCVLYTNLTVYTTPTTALYFCPSSPHSTTIVHVSPTHPYNKRWRRKRRKRR